MKQEIPSLARKKLGKRHKKLGSPYCDIFDVKPEDFEISNYDSYLVLNMEKSTCT